MLRKSIFRYLIVIALCAAAVLCISGAFAEQRPVPEPNAGLVYCADWQDGFSNLQEDWYKTSGTLSAIDAGTYEAVFTLKNPGDTWNDGSTTFKAVEWTIAPYTPAVAPDIKLSNIPIYDGTPKTQLIKPVMLDGFDDAATYELSGNTQTVVGEYTLTVRGTKNFSFEATKSWFILSPDKIVVDTKNVQKYDDKPIVTLDEGKLKTNVNLDPGLVTSISDHITITVEANTTELTEEEKDQYDKQFNTNIDEAGIYGVVDINLKVEGKPDYIRELLSPIKVELTLSKVNLPGGDYNKKSITVVGFHRDDEAARQMYLSRIDIGRCAVDNSTIYVNFMNDKFSKFAIIDGGPVPPKTGDETPLIIYAASIVLAAGVIWFLIRRRAR